MVSYGSNYPDGVNGSEDYFNPPPRNVPECPSCGRALEWEWDYCPWCGDWLSAPLYDSRRDYEFDRGLDAMDGR